MTRKEAAKLRRIDTRREHLLSALHVLHIRLSSSHDLGCQMAAKYAARKIREEMKAARKEAERQGGGKQ